MEVFESISLMATGLLPRNASSQNSDFDEITTRNLTVNNVAVIRTLIATNLTFSNVNATTATISGLTTTGSLNISGVPTITTTINALTRESNGSIRVNPSLVDLLSTQTLYGKTLTTPIIAQIQNGGQNVTVPSGISSIFALQSAGAQTANNLATYFNSSPTPAVLQDSGIALSSVVTLTGTQTLSNKAMTAPVVFSGTSTSTTTITAGNSGLCGIYYDKAGAGTDTNHLLFDDTITGIHTTLIPSTGGTLALTSQIPTNLQYVDLTTGQTVGGAKTFSSTLKVGTAATDQISISTATVSIVNSTGVASVSLAGGEATAGASITAASGTLNFNTSNASSPTLRLAILNTGIATDNTITSMLGLSGTNLTIKNNVVDTTTTQSLSGKSFTDASFSLLNGKEIHQSWATTSNTNTALTTLTIGIATTTSVTLTSVVNAYVTSGPDAGKSTMRRLTSRVINVAGTVTVTTVEYITNNDTGLDATALTHVASGTNVLVKFAGITGDSMAVTGVTVEYL